jgi:hypothetical protein
MVLPNTSNVIGMLGVTVSSGAGVPTHGAPKGSLFVNLTGSSTSTRMYVNTDGGTTWTNFTTAA